MIASPFMLIPMAKQAGMNTPPADEEDYDRNEYPHFMVYSAMQCGRPIINARSHWTNAEIVASIPEDRIRTTTPHDLMSMGFQ